MDRVRSLRDRDRDRIWHPYTQTGFGVEPLPVSSAKGAVLILEDGRRVIDGISSWWCCLHGHGHKALVRAASEQFERLDHVLFAGVTHEPAVSLAEQLCEVYPHDFSRVFYSDNGSTAVEVALKLAIQVWRNRGDRRVTLVALEGGYHGDTFGAMAVGARSIFSAPFEDLLFSVEYLSPGGGEASVARCRDLARRGDIAAFIFEPAVQGAGGMRFVESEVLDLYCSEFRRAGALCIADEVMTGFGRTGPLFATSELKVAPDLVCLSKGITSGTLPLAVTLCRENLFQEFISDDHSRTFFHGHTYTANPIACAVALSSLSLSHSAECIERRGRIERSHTEFVGQMLEKRGIENPRVRGTILAFNVASNGDAGYANPITRRARDFFLERGVLLRPLGNVVYCMPPYCVTDAELHQVYEALGEFVNEVAR